MRLALLLALVAAPALAQSPCEVFPEDNPWNLDVSALPKHPLSDIFIASIELGSTTKRLHPDFGVIPEYGIPYVYVGASQPRVPITYDAYGDESDPGPFPIPPDAPIEGAGAAGDRHVLVVDTAACMLYELFAARKDAAGAGWTAESGAVFDLTTNTYRPDGWTSADAAGLPIYPGLVRYDEVAAGVIDHALRFTSRYSQRGWIHPARHQAGRADTTYPPMGLRLRLRADYDLGAVTGQARVILEALKRYGMILADNGTSWFISGTSDPRWDIEELNQLKRVPGSAFEAVYTGEIKRRPEVLGVASEASVRISLAGGRISVTGMRTPARLRLVDLAGRILRTGEESISTADLAPGAYLLHAPPRAFPLLIGASGTVLGLGE